MSKRKKQNFGDVRRAARTTQTADKMTYYTLVVLMRDGKREFRRFHMAVDARKLSAHEQQKFVAFAVMSLGISPKNMADLGGDPSAKLEVFNSEQEAKAHYDWLLQEFGPVVPGEGPLC